MSMLIKLDVHAYKKNMYDMNRTKRGQLLICIEGQMFFCDKHYPLIFICIVYWDLAFLVINPDYNYGGPKGLMNFDQKHE